MFKLVVSDTITVPVQGKLPEENGRLMPFSFNLIARRLPARELKLALETNDVTVPDFLVQHVQGWANVCDADGRELPFSQSNLQTLLDIVGMASVCFTAYIEACGARGKEKN